MSLEHRINQLEQQAGGPGLPWYAVKQSGHDDNLWDGPDGASYTTAELQALGERYRLIIITWSDGKNWRDDFPGANHIRLRWPD